MMALTKKDNSVWFCHVCTVAYTRTTHTKRALIQNTNNIGREEESSRFSVRMRASESVIPLLHQPSGVLVHGIEHGTWPPSRCVELE